MNRDVLLKYLQDLYREFDATLPTDPGTPIYDAILRPLVEKFGDDPYTPDVKDYIVDLLSSEFPDLDFSALSSYADIVVTPFKIIIEPLRREILRLKMAQSLAYKDYLTEEEIEGLVSVFQVLRQKGSKARVTVRIYFRAPKYVEINFSASAYTADGLGFVPVEFYSFTPEMVMENREGEYYYVEGIFEAVEEGTAYNIGPDKIVGVNGISGAIWARNPTSASPGTDRETIDEYLDRLTSWVSEHAPVTKSGIISKVMEAFPAITDIAVVGNGEPAMYRDNVSLDIKTEATLPTGHGTGSLIPWKPGNLPEVPYAYGLSGSFADILPPIVPPGHSPVSFVIDGVEVGISSITNTKAILKTFFADGSPYGSAGTTGLEYAVPNGVVIPHTVGLVQPGMSMSGIKPNDILLIYNGEMYEEHKILSVDKVSGEDMLVLKGPIEIIRTSPTGIDPEKTNYKITHYGDAVEFRASIGNTPIKFLTPKVVEVGTRLVISHNGATHEYLVSYVNPEFLCIAHTNPDDPPSAPPQKGSGTLILVDEPTRSIMDNAVNFLELGVVPGDEFFDCTLNRHAQIIEVGPHILTLAKWIPGLAAKDKYKIFGTTQEGNELIVDAWVIYQRPDGNYEDDLPKQNNLTWAVLADPTNLLPMKSSEVTWQSRRRALSSDLYVVASLPDGTVQQTIGGRIHLGGCTDVYMVAAEENFMTSFDSVNDLAPLATGKGTWTAGTDSIFITNLKFNEDYKGQKTFGKEGPFLPLIPIVVEVKNTDPKEIYHVTATSKTESGLCFRVSAILPNSGKERDILIYADHYLDLLATKNVKTSSVKGPQAQIGFSPYVILDAPVDPSVEVGDMFSITSGAGKGTYSIEAILSGGTVLKLDSSVAGFAFKVPYEIYSVGEGITVPLSKIGHLELSSDGGKTAINVYYREPLACRVIGDSHTDGPDIIIPQSPDEPPTYNLCSVIRLDDDPDLYEGAALGLAAWSGNVEGLNVRPNNVLILRGHNNYSARILSAVYDGEKKVSYILFAPYDYAVLDEDDVPFEIHAAQVAKVRLYFEQPTAVTIGYWYPNQTTLFSNGPYTFIVHPDYRENIPLDIPYSELIIDATKGKTNKIGTASKDLDFELLGLKPGDIVDLKYGAIISAEVPKELEIAGKSLILDVGGVQKTAFFSGIGPISLWGPDGVADQIERAFGITVLIRDTSIQNQYRIFLISQQKLTVVGGTALEDLKLPKVSNDILPEDVKGTHTILAVKKDAIYVDTVFSSTLTGDAAIIAAFIRVGVKHTSKSQMEGSREYGFPYTDIEVLSTQDAKGSFLPSGSYLSISGRYYSEGFAVETRQEVSFGPKEKPMLRLTPTVSTESGNILTTASYGFDLHYTSVPVITVVQAVLSSDDVRATADNLMAKQKPSIELGVGPLSYLGETESIKQTIFERMRARISELRRAGSPIVLKDILAAISPLGVTYSGKTTLIWRYEDLNRRRYLRFGDFIQMDPLWRIIPSQDLIIFESE